jgi:hypothetical protein
MKPPTAIEKLLADKSDVEAKCKLQEKKLADDFEYIRKNASFLLLSGISFLLFSNGHTKKKSETQSVALASSNLHKSGPLNW